MRSLLSCLVVGLTIATVPALAQSQAKLQGSVNTWQKALAADVKFQQKILADMQKTSDPAKLSRLQATLAEQNRTVQQSQNNLHAAQQQLKSAPAAAAPPPAKLPAVASKPAPAKPTPGSLPPSVAPSGMMAPPAPMVHGGGGNVAPTTIAPVISGGAGNVISGGAGNVISGGAGNVISGGAGNVISGGAGNVISGGAGNAVPQRSLMSTSSGPARGNAAPTRPQR